MAGSSIIHLSILQEYFSTRDIDLSFYKDLDTNFEQALEMSEKDFSHEELIEMLEKGNIPQKQIAALKLDTVNNQDEASLLVSNLTGCDGKIREAVALKINQILILEPNKYFLFIYPEVFANASIDINGNICRLVLDSVKVLIISAKFKEKYIQRILCFINESFTELDNFIFRDKKYVINKQLFKLYWCLEALKLFAEELPQELILPILSRTAKEREYTIREKTAQILVKLNSEKFLKLVESLKLDENYYVRNAFLKVS